LGVRARDFIQLLRIKGCERGTILRRARTANQFAGSDHFCRPFGRREGFRGQWIIGKIIGHSETQLGVSLDGFTSGQGDFSFFGRGAGHSFGPCRKEGGKIIPRLRGSGTHDDAEARERSELAARIICPSGRSDLSPNDPQSNGAFSRAAGYRRRIGVWKRPESGAIPLVAIGRTS